jgi:superfamily II DNA/RNA helicase
MKGECNPPANYLDTQLRLLLLSEGLAKSMDAEFDQAHYLVGLGLEQTGEVTDAFDRPDTEVQDDPLKDDYWTRFSLATLHYLAGGFRTQALSSLERLKTLATRRNGSVQYPQMLAAIQKLASGRVGPVNARNDWERILLTDRPVEARVASIRSLATKILVRRQDLVHRLGEENTELWLASRGLPSTALDFWKRFLESLRQRGITPFSDVRIWDALDEWLQVESHAFFCLPTGAGKSIIGELRTAMTLASGKSVVWILPTRSLVRQTKKNLRRAFAQLGVPVQELPGSEDFSPIFEEDTFERPVVCASTPERLHALARANPVAFANVGLVVFDEAQTLNDKSRGITVEGTLAEVKAASPTCRFVLLTGFEDLREKIATFLDHLVGEYVKIFSEDRPTRRIHGVVTALENADKKFFTALFYPPRPQDADPATHRDFISISIARPNGNAPSQASAIYKFFAAKLNKAKVRTVVFVATKPQTGSVARAIARASRGTIREAPQQYVDRLDLELGRDSDVMTTAINGVSPHHAGLTPLEQHVVESLMRDGQITTVVATPTLAQGVNLPFDVSLVTYLKRRNIETSLYEPVPLAEVRNMLGRAGRAGLVSDGLCLIAMKQRPLNARSILARSKSVFFTPVIPSTDAIGMQRLKDLAIASDLASITWVFELTGMTLPEAQTLVSFACRIREELRVDELEVSPVLRTFPSLATEHDIDLVVFQNVLLGLADRLSTVSHDDLVMGVIRKTGLPVEFVVAVVERVRRFGASDQVGLSDDNWIAWTDAVVFEAFEACATRHWLQKSMGNLQLETMRTIIMLWRNGSAIASIEQYWPVPDPDKARMKTGEFLNHKLALVSQFWGIFAVIEEIDASTLAAESSLLKQLPVLVREGIDSIRTQDWLHAIGGVDRVLAHALSPMHAPSRGSSHERHTELKETLKRWVSTGEIDSISLGQTVIAAARGLLLDKDF